MYPFGHWFDRSAIVTVSNCVYACQIAHSTCRQCNVCSEYHMAESFGSTYHDHDSIIVSAGVDEFVQLVLDVQHGMRHLFHQAFSSSILPCSHLQAKAAMSNVCNLSSMLTSGSSGTCLRSTFACLMYAASLYLSNDEQCHLHHCEPS